MKESFITEAEKHTEIAGKYDVIVAGSVGLCGCRYRSKKRGKNADY